MEHFDARVRFLLGAVAVLATVHRALAAADRREPVQPERDELSRVERVDDAPTAAGLRSVD